MQHFTSLLLLYIGCRTLPIYVKLSDLVTYYDTVCALDTFLDVTFASPLSYFTGLKYTVQSSHTLVLCPESCTFWVDASSACNVSSASSASASSASSASYLSTLLVPRSNLLCCQSCTFCVDPSSACDDSSCSSTSAASPSSLSYRSTSLDPW